MAQPNPTRRRWALVAAAVAVLAVVAAALLLWPDDVGELAVPEASDTSETTPAVPPDDDGSVPGPAPSDSTPTDAETSTAGSDAPAPHERVPAFVVSARIEDGATILSVDYIQFLTGEEAAAAAAERGDESPPPNDYYIVNDNPTVREFPIAPNLSVRVVAKADGTTDPAGYTMSVKDWAAAVNGPAGSAFKSGIYYITLADGTVTMIEQLYLP